MRRDPHHIATLVLRYLRGVAGLEAEGLPVDWSLPVDPAADELAPPWAGDSLPPIPGRQPIGYLPADSLIRDYTRADVRRALAILEVEEPTMHQVLLEELGYPSFGAFVEFEWCAAAKLYDRLRELRYELEVLHRAVRSGKRRMGDVSWAILELENEREAILDEADGTLLATTHLVLEAAVELDKYLPPLRG
jgi:hypothetical protein